MPMAKRRVKTPQSGGAPPLLWSDEHQKWYEEGTTLTHATDDDHLPHWLDIEAERERLKLSEYYEDIGRQVGVVLHWLIVKPLQLLYHLAYHAVWLAVIILKNIGTIAMWAWMAFFFGGIIYFYFKITGG